MKFLYEKVYHLSENIGARQAGSPAARQACQWLQKQLQSANLRTALYDFKCASSSYTVYQFVFFLSFFVSLVYNNLYVYLKIPLIVIQILNIYIFFMH